MRRCFGSPWLVALIVAAATFAYRYFSFVNFNNDHFLHLARAQQMLMGELPVRDFVESGMPLMAALSAAAQAIGGRGLYAEVVLTCGLFAVASGLMYVVALNLSGSGWLAAAASMLLAAAYPLSYSYPKVAPYVVSFLAAWHYFARPAAWRLTLLAATVVVAFLLRHDHGLILAVGAGAALITYGGGRREAWMELAWFTAAGLVLVAPYLAWVQLYQGLPNYVAEAAAFTEYEMGKASWKPPSFYFDRQHPFVERTRFRQGPVIHVRWAAGVDERERAVHEASHQLRRLDAIGPQSWQYELSRWTPDDLRVLVTDAAIIDTDGINRQTFRLTNTLTIDRVETTLHPEIVLNQRNGVAAMYYLAWLLPAGAFLLRDRAPRALVAMAVMLVVVQLLMNRSMLRDPLASRVRDVVAPMMALLPLTCARLWTLRRGSVVGVMLKGLASATLVLAATAVVLAGDLPQHIDDAISGDVRPPYMQSRSWSGPAAKDSEIVEYLRACSPQGSRFLALTFAPELLFSTGHGFAGGHESLVPGYYITAADTALMLERVAREDVPFTIMDSETAGRIRDQYPRLIAFVDARYVEVASFPIGQGKSFIVLADSQRPSVRRVGERLLPCFAGAAASS